MRLMKNAEGCRRVEISAILRFFEQQRNAAAHLRKVALVRQRPQRERVRSIELPRHAGAALAKHRIGIIEKWNGGRPTAHCEFGDAPRQRGHGQGMRMSGAFGETLSQVEELLGSFPSSAA